MKAGPAPTPALVAAQLAAVQSMMFDQLEHALSRCLRNGHDRARHWNGGLDTLVNRGVEKPDVSPGTMEKALLVAHMREASGLYCDWNPS